MYEVLATLSNGLLSSGRVMRENPNWTPLQRQIYRALSWPLLLTAAIVVIGGLVFLWIGLHEGWLLPEAK